MSIPTAILLGSVIIAVGLVVGLGGRTEAPHVASPAAPSIVVASSQQVVTPVETVMAQAREALEYQHGELRARCPVPPGESHKFTINVTFDAQGTEVSRGLMEDPSNPPSSLGMCLPGVITPLRIPPPGKETWVEIPLRMP